MKFSNKETADNRFRDCFLVIGDESDSPKPLAVVFLRKTRLKWEGESFYFKLGLDGVLQKAFALRGNYDASGRPVRGSGVEEILDGDSPEARERLQYELDFWLKGRHRRKRQDLEVAGTPQTAPADEERLQGMIEKAVKAAAAKPAQAFSSDVDLPSYKNPENPDDFALVVGIEKYTDLPEAQFAQRDAEAVREHLAAMGFPQRNIVFLAGPKATRTGLAKHVETWLPRSVSERSSVFFYYAGHGAPDPATGEAYLLPVDGDPQFLKDTGYPLRRLYEKLDSLKARRVIVALDSCFSGAGGRSVLPRGTRPLVTKVRLGMPGQGKIVSFSASDSDQVSGALEEQGHGLFTYYFLRGLNGEAKDKSGAVTVQSLYDYLLPRVRDMARRLGEREQTPRLLPSLPEKGLTVLR